MDGFQIYRRKVKEFDKETVIQLCLSQQEQFDHNLQMALEQMADLKRHCLGRSAERHVADGQLSFMEEDGKIVFFNEPEAVVEEFLDGESDEVYCRYAFTPAKVKLQEPQV